MGESFAQLWENLIGRTTGPLHLRLLLQPAVAAFFGIRAGLKDAREGRTPYGWAILSEPMSRGRRLQEGWDHVGKVFLIAMVFDGIYQFMVFHRVYVTGVVIIAFTLAVIPYLVFRGFVNRIASLRASRNDRAREKAGD